MTEGEIAWSSNDGRIVVQCLGTIDRWSRQHHRFVHFVGYAVKCDGRVMLPLWLTQSNAIALAEVTERCGYAVRKGQVA